MQHLLLSFTAMTKDLNLDLLAQHSYHNPTLALRHKSWNIKVKEMQIKDSREQEDVNFAAAELHNSKILYDIFQARLMQTALVGHQAGLVPPRDWQQCKATWSDGLKTKSYTVCDIAPVRDWQGGQLDPPPRNASQEA